MKTKVTFKGLSEGKIVYRHIQIRHNFSIIPGEIFLGYQLPAQSVESQVIDYLDSINKSEIMLKYNLEIIIDYWVPKKKKKVNELQSFIEYLKPYVTPTTQRPIEAIISESKDILFGKGKSNYDKAVEVFTILKMCYKSSSGTVQSLLKLFHHEESEANKIYLEPGIY